MRPAGHWMRLTATNLRALGHAVWYPQFPNPTEPQPAEWQQLLVDEAAQMDELGAALSLAGKSGGEKIAVTHSLGCINFLVAARAGRFAEAFDRVVFVAPPDPQLLQPIEGAVIDLGDSAWYTALRESTKHFTLVSSEADHWLPRGIHETYISHWPDVSPVIVPGAKHFSLDDGWGEWTGLTDWLTTKSLASEVLQRR